MVGEELVGYDAVSGRRRQSPSGIDFFCMPMTIAVGDSRESSHIESFFVPNVDIFVFAVLR